MTRERTKRFTIEHAGSQKYPHYITGWVVIDTWTQTGAHLPTREDCQEFVDAVIALETLREEGHEALEGADMWHRLGAIAEEHWRTQLALRAKAGAR